MWFLELVYDFCPWTKIIKWKTKQLHIQKTKHNNSKGDIVLSKFQSSQKHGQQINTNSSHLSTQRIALLSSPIIHSSQLFADLTICQCTSDPPCIWTNVLPWILHQNARTYEDHSISCWVSQHPLGYQSLVDDSQRLQANQGYKQPFGTPTKTGGKKWSNFKLWKQKKSMYLLLMVQNSHSQPPGMYKTLYNNETNYLSSGAGFLPSNRSTRCKVTISFPVRWRLRFLAFDFGSRVTFSPSQKGHKLAELPGTRWTSSRDIPFWVSMNVGGRFFGGLKLLVTSI